MLDARRMEWRDGKRKETGRDLCCQKGKRFVSMGELATISIGDCQIRGVGDCHTCDERVSMPRGRRAACHSNPRLLRALSPRVCKHSLPVYHRRGIDGDSSNYKYLESTRRALLSSIARNAFYKFIPGTISFSKEREFDSDFLFRVFETRETL